MQCPKCQHDNPEDAKFCNECAHKLEAICPECGKSNPPNSKFCNECAYNLVSSEKIATKEITYDEKLEKLQKYLPQGITEKVLSQRDKIEGERKKVTVMFCDMVGFTPLVEKIGPEEAYLIMDQIYEILIQKVRDYGGTVNEMTGDGIMALFGAPIALEDASQRAIRSAYSIHREMVRFNDARKQDKGSVPVIKMRIGIHTGDVVVGTLGNDLRIEFKAVGDTVNTASRMEGLAESGTTYVSNDTFKLTEGFFRFEGIGEKQVKGKAEPVQVYRVIGPSTLTTRFDVNAEKGLTPFVGRERELELLLDGFERAKSGRGQAFSIMGEAGVGKSRLLYEFRKAVTNENLTFLEGKCLSFGQGVAYHPIIDILKGNFDIQENDTDLDIRTKVTKGLKNLGIEDDLALPYFFELLSVKDSGFDQIIMTPEGKKHQTIEVLKRIVLKGSELRPIVMAIEDLHWADKSSEDTFRYLLEAIAGSRIFFIVTYRPEFIPTWSAKSYHNQLTLNRLSNRESLSMIYHLLGTDDIDSALQEVILEKTEGIPFFIEEMLKSLKDLYITEKRDNRYSLSKQQQEISVPSTIQDVIMSRVDALPEGARKVLQTGSVIEREFGHDLIQNTTGLSNDELLSFLSLIKDSELIYERGVYPYSTYIFKHALTRDVVYASILAKRRISLHKVVADAIEELNKDSIEEHYGPLLEHYIKSENFVKAAEYSDYLARKSTKTGGLIGAITSTEKRILMLEKLPKNKEIEKAIIGAKIRIGLYQTQLDNYIEAKHAIDPIIEIAKENYNKREISNIYTILGTYYCMIEENYHESLKYLEEAYKIAIDLNDSNSIVQSCLFLGVHNIYASDFKSSLYYLNKALEISLEVNNKWGVTNCKSLQAITCIWFGKVEKGYEISEEAVRLSEESGDIYSKGMAYTIHGFSCYFKGYFGKAEKLALSGAEFCEKIKRSHYNAIAHDILGNIYFETGNYSKSIEHNKKAISIREPKRLMNFHVILNKISLEKARVMNNDFEIDMDNLYELKRKNKTTLGNGELSRSLAGILLHTEGSNFKKTKTEIEKAIEADKKNGTKWQLGRDYALYAQIYKNTHDVLKAKEHLGKAIEIMKDCGSDGWVEIYEKEIVMVNKKRTQS